MKLMTTLGALVLMTTFAAAAERKDWTLPANATVKESGPRAYRWSVDYLTLDTKGREMRLERLTATYTRGLPEDRMRWTDVEMADSTGSVDQLSTPKKREFMEGFSYTRAGAAKMLEADFFTGFPPMAMQERNMVWDTAMLEEFIDKMNDLKLNVPYSHSKDQEMQLGTAGNFKNKNLQLIWSGFSQRNGQECAIIDYRAFLNTLDVKLPVITLIGRSHYWGQVWVSLTTKRIEYATLYEDVLGELTMQGQEKPIIVNVLRTGTFEPISK